MVVMVRLESIVEYDSDIQEAYLRPFCVSKGAEK